MPDHAPQLGGGEGLAQNGVHHPATGLDLRGEAPQVGEVHNGQARAGAGGVGL